MIDQLSCSSVIDWKFQCLPPMELELQRQWPWRTQPCPQYFTGAGSQGLFSWIAKRHCPAHFPDLCPEWTHLSAQLIWTSLFPTSFSPIADPCCFLSAVTHNLSLPSQEGQHQTNVPSVSFLLRGWFSQRLWGTSCYPGNMRFLPSHPLYFLSCSSPNSGLPTLSPQKPALARPVNFAKQPYSVSAVNSAPKGLHLVSTKVLTSSGPGAATLL